MVRRQPWRAPHVQSRHWHRRLFDPGVVARAESGDRLLVRAGYSGRLPALPGVAIISAATGCLTAAGAKTRGALHPAAAVV
jgi:hypothetical protein